MPSKNPEKKANPERVPTSEIPVPTYPIKIPTLPLPKPGTEALHKVGFDTALLFITQEAHPESVGVARAWIDEFLTRGRGLPPKEITDFLESRADQLPPVFHSPAPDLEIAEKLYKAGLYKFNRYINPHSHPPGVPDYGGFLLTELPNWYQLFTQWYWSVVAIEIPGADTEIAEQQAKQDARTQLLKLLRAVQKAKQDAEIASQEAEIAEQKVKQEVEIARLASWGFREPVDLAHLPEEAFLSSQVIHQDWCRYSDERWFTKWVGRSDEYPADLLAFRVITRIGYDRLIKKEQDAIRTRNTQIIQAKREKQASPGNPLPKPNRKPSSRKSNVSNEKK